MTQQQYLQNGGWKTSHIPHHEQPWVKESMKSFHSKLCKWEQRLCSVCHEAWPTQNCLNNDPCTFVCTRCKRDKRPIKLFSAENDMLPREVPLPLQGLSQLEEMLIARACPIMCVYRNHGGQRGYKGHVVNLPQDIQEFLTRLPCYVNQLPVLLLRRTGKDNSHIDLRVCQHKVLAALRWLQLNNPFFSNITIDHVALQTLPYDGIPTELQTIEDEHSSTVEEHVINPEVPHNSHSFVPVPMAVGTEDEAIRATFEHNDPFDWPNISNKPINEFRTPGLASQVFPTLFPYGAGDPTFPGRQHKVSLTDGFKHLERYADVVEGAFHWRFASHPRFPYWALNMKQRHQLISQASVYLHQNQTDANLSIDNLRDMVGRLSAEHLMHRLQRYAAKIHGSHPYWFQRYTELRSLIEQKGPPTFFWTVSSADTFWPELHKLLPHTTGTNLDHNSRICAVIDNPHITDWFFYTKLTDWVQHWLYDALGADWHWYRFEYQARGSTHAHGCAKLSSDPDICRLIQKVAAAWNILEEESNGTVIQQDDREQVLKEGEEAKAEVLSYCDWLVTTCNDAVPDALWSLPNPHPCTVSIHNVVDLEDDYHDLVNSVQRHTRCSTAYCLKKRSEQQTPQCRFNYPRPNQTHSTLEFEKLGDGIIRATLISKRNDPRLNSHSHLLIQNWRANVDLQVVVDVHACARYMAKYVAKAEPRSKSVSDIFTSCVQACPHDGNSTSVLRSAMIRAVGERDISAQETAHMLLSLPLTSCTFSFCILSLTGDRKIKRDAETDKLSLHHSFLELYSRRTTNLQLSLLQFASEYIEYKGELKKRSTPVIVRAFPFYSSDPAGDNYNLYCKYQLIKHQPWVGQPCNAWGGGDGTPSQWIEEYHSFLQTDTAVQGIPYLNDEIRRSQQRLEEADSEDEPEHPEEIQDEWMQLCQLNPRFNISTETFANVDWATSARELPSPLLRESPHWISSQRQTAESSASSPWLRQLPTIDVATLNSKQLQAYNHIKLHYSQYQANQSPPPLHIIVSGTAGTGKSYLISALAHLLGSSCVITATTGMASFNICGKTLHSTLKLPVRKNNHRDLQGASLQQLQLTMRDKHYLIIDEMSMIGHRMMA